ncbi:hypothetical protein V865_007250 [Kwoniella europaea PYCC6329]|uniref:SWIM-type domain-containing protein n=1 Tax=Kwoniella europaea PYCC6329 TaxID=1423913 RepID=A0AAX4KUX7_9TREE
MDQVEAGLDDRKWRTSFLNLLKKAGFENLILILKVCVVGVTGAFRKKSEEGWDLYSVGAVKGVGKCRGTVGLEEDEARVEPRQVMAIRDDEGNTKYACSCSISSCEHMVAVEFFKLGRDRTAKDADEDMDIDENLINPLLKQTTQLITPTTIRSVPVSDTHPLLATPEEPSHKEYDAIRAFIEMVVHINPARADHFEVQHRGGDPMRQDGEENEDQIYLAGLMQQMIKSFRLDFTPIRKSSKQR